MPEFHLTKRTDRPATIEEHAELRAEIEKLRERCEAYKGQVLAGSQQIERFRAALERIAGGDGYYPDYARAVLYGGSEHNAELKEKT